MPDFGSTLLVLNIAILFAVPLFGAPAWWD